MPRTVLILVTLIGLVASPPASAASWEWPVRGEVITRYENGSDPYAGGRHRGIDIAARVGTPVVAPTPGIVRFAGVAGSSGRVVSIRTADGALDTSYLHLSSASVRKGQRVRAGTAIGRVGTTGRRSAEQAHLHFGVRTAGRRHAYRDPLPLLGPLPAPAREPRPAPAPAPTPVPVAPRPEPVRGRVPVPEPLGAPRRAPLPAPRARPAPARAARPAAQAVPRLAPDLAPAPQPVGARPPDLGGHMRPLPPPMPEAEPGGGPMRSMLPWALACAALLLAAAGLGTPRDRDGARPARERLAALLPRMR